MLSSDKNVMKLVYTFGFKREQILINETLISKSIIEQFSSALGRQSYTCAKDLLTIFHRTIKPSFQKHQKIKIFANLHHRLAWIIIVSSSHETPL